jgi:hypothetical protein
VPFDVKMNEYLKEMTDLLNKENELNEKIKDVFKSLGWKI